MAKVTKEQHKKYLSYLAEYLPDISTCYVFQVSQSSTGMSTTIAVFVPIKTESGTGFMNISFHVAAVLGWKYSQSKRAVIVQGAGMDLGFHMVEALGRELGLTLKHQWL